MEWSCQFLAGVLIRWVHPAGARAGGCTELSGAFSPVSWNFLLRPGFHRGEPASHRTDGAGTEWHTRSS
jgi:hypothetical protein